MYNLFVRGHAGSWNGDPWTVDRSRCISGTDDDITERFGDLDTSQVRELSRFPCIFAYEAWEKDPKFGFIRDVIVQRSRAEVKVKYDLIACESFLTADDLSELETALHIRGGERGRTHWAVKDVDLYRLLQEMKGISLPGRDEVTPNLDLPTDSATNDDLWKPDGAPRLFMSHLAARKKEVHDLTRMLKQFGFACFVAHDEIEPSREWRREIERALDSCDVLVAYVTREFSASHWDRSGNRLGAWAWLGRRSDFSGWRDAARVPRLVPGRNPDHDDVGSQSVQAGIQGDLRCRLQWSAVGRSSGLREGGAACHQCPGSCEYHRRRIAVP